MRRTNIPCKESAFYIACKFTQCYTTEGTKGETATYTIKKRKEEVRLYIDRRDQITYVSENNKIGRESERR